MSKDVLTLAREAGLRVGPAGMGQTVWGSDEELKRFAELVRADERAQRKPLTLGQKQRLWSSVGDKPTLKDRVNAYGLAIEAAHNIKENT